VDIDLKRHPPDSFLMAGHEPVADARVAKAKKRFAPEEY
jgi:hypothetical protein